MATIGIRYIQIPVSEEEFSEIDRLKGRTQSWRDYALPRLMQKGKKFKCFMSLDTKSKDLREF